MSTSYILDPNYVPMHENMIEMFPDEGFAKVYFQNHQYKNIGYFLTDIDDLPIVRKYKWHKSTNKRKNINHKRATDIISSDNSIKLIYLILRLNFNIKNVHIIFKNGNRFDLRKSNLEVVYFTRYIDMNSPKYRVHYKNNKGEVYRVFHSDYLDEAMYASYIFRSNYHKLSEIILDNDLIELEKFGKFISNERKEEIKRTVINKSNEM